MLERCLATPAVHVVEVPIDYTAGAALQVRLDPSQTRAIAHASKQTLVGLFKPMWRWMCIVAHQRDA